MSKAKIEINVHKDRCPCGSGKTIIDCHYKDINCAPPGIVTGFSHPKCYASQLNDCSEDISREHYISESVLRLFGNQLVSSLKCHPADKPLSLNAFASKMLCSRHNSALSDLDDCARYLFSCLLGKNDQRHIIVKGENIEKWMVKLMCGLIKTGLFDFPKDHDINTFVNVLFKNEPVPKGYGFAVAKFTTGSYVKDGIQANIISQYGLLFGVNIRLDYLSFQFLTGTISSVEDQDDLKPLIYHKPRGISIDRGDIYREIHFGEWPGEFVFVDIK